MLAWRPLHWKLDIHERRYIIYRGCMLQEDSDPYRHQLNLIRVSTCHISRGMRFPTMWYVRPAKAQTSLRIRAVWSESLLHVVAWLFYDCYATDWTYFGVSKLKRRLHRLVWVYTCQNTTLLELICRSSHEKNRRVLTYPLSAQQKLWPDWAEVQANLSLRIVHTHAVDFVMS